MEGYVVVIERSKSCTADHIYGWFLDGLKVAILTK